MSPRVEDPVVTLDRPGAGPDAPVPAVPAAVPRATGRRRLVGTTIAIALSLAVMALLGATLRVGGTKPLGQNPEGTPAPGFTLPLLDGSGEASLSDFRGKPVILNFWASWCGPCKQEAPILAAGWERWSPKGVVFLGVNAQDSKRWALDFEQDYGIRYQSVVDTNEDTMQAYGVLGFPETFFIDRDGRIVTKYAGPLDADTLDANAGAIAAP